MNQYHKIQTVFKRDPETKFKTLLEGEYSLPEFKYLANNHWVFTEKVDGTNIRVMFDGNQIIFGGKTDNAQIPTPLLNNLNALFLPQIDKFQTEFSDGVCLYGEGYGGKIQKAGSTYGPEQRFVLFDVKVGRWWLERKNVEGIAVAFGVDIVPIIGGGSLDRMVNTVREGFMSQWGGFFAEGIVARPMVEMQTRIKRKDFV
jgi:hypothetical protein